jgi:hypothetical protein
MTWVSALPLEPSAFLTSLHSLRGFLGTWVAFLRADVTAAVLLTPLPCVHPKVLSQLTGLMQWTQSLAAAAVPAAAAAAGVDLQQEPLHIQHNQNRDPAAWTLH